MQSSSPAKNLVDFEANVVKAIGIVGGNTKPRLIHGQSEETF